MLDQCLISTLEWWNGLALALIQSGANDRSVAEIDLAVWALLPCQGVLHPILIITLWKVLTGVGTT
jgi:hypothetical protein